MKLSFLFILLISAESFSCAETTSNSSEYLEDIKASTLDDGQTCVNILLKSFNASNDQHVSEVRLNIKNKNKNSVAIISPKAYSNEGGQLLYSACFSQGYIDNTIIELFIGAKPSISLNDGISHSQNGSLCSEIEYIELGKAIEAHKKGK